MDHLNFVILISLHQRRSVAAIYIRSLSRSSIVSDFDVNFFVISLIVLGSVVNTFQW